MTRSELLIPILACFMQRALFADGGVVRMQKETAGYVITVFTQGASDFSVLVQARDGLTPVLDAAILLTLEDSSGERILAHPTHDLARNKLLYAALVSLPKPGNWKISVAVDRNGGREEASGIIQVAPPSEHAGSHIPEFAAVPLIAGLFVIRNRLIARKTAHI